MKKLLGLFLSFTLLVAGCTNNSKNEPMPLAVKRNAEVKKISDYISKYQAPSQKFQVPSDKPSQIKGKQGTIIPVNPQDLITENGQPLGKNIEVELQELTNQAQLLNSNAQTVSDGKILVSGGAYYINITSEGQQLKLKEGKSLKIQFPKISNNEMSLFYGQRDSTGRINWKQANQMLKAINNRPREDSAKGTQSRSKGQLGSLINYLAKDTGSKALTKEEKERIQKEAKLEQAVYNAVNINSFGWINCDHFLEVENKTDLFVRFNPADSILCANVYLVFQDINSLMNAGYTGDSLETAKYGFGNIPIGYKVKLVAFTVKGDKVYSSSSDLIIKEHETITVSMKETNEADFKKLLKF